MQKRHLLEQMMCTEQGICEEESIAIESVMDSTFKEHYFSDCKLLLLLYSKFYTDSDDEDPLKSSELEDFGYLTNDIFWDESLPTDKSQSIKKFALSQSHDEVCDQPVDQDLSFCQLQSQSLPNLSTAKSFHTAKEQNKIMSHQLPTINLESTEFIEIRF